MGKNAREAKEQGKRTGGKCKGLGLIGGDQAEAEGGEEEGEIKKKDKTERMMVKREGGSTMKINVPQGTSSGYAHTHTTHTKSDDRHRRC